MNRHCNCIEWRTYIWQIIDAQEIVALHDGEYTGDVFSYCPWCGSELFEIDPAQAWFWTEEWQEGELEVDEEIREGRCTEYASINDMIDDLIAGEE